MCTRPSPKAAVAYICGEAANVESHLARQACEHNIQIRSGVKINYSVIAYFRVSVCAKNYTNQTVLATVVAKNVGNPFLRHGIVAAKIVTVS